MKKTYLLALLTLMFSCDKGESGVVDENDNTVTTTEKPAAVDDSSITVEDTAVTTANVLANDKVPQGTRIKSFESKSQQNAEVIDNRDATFTYTPANGFVGIDKFTYTICDNQSPENCSTATVTVTVTDEGNPTANPDTVKVVYNTTVILSNLLENDDLTDGAKLSSVNQSSTKGSVTVNNDNSVTYTPLTDSLESDSFSYTICDDDSPTASCATATVSVTILEPLSFNIPAELQNYYGDTFFTTDESANLLALQSLTRTKHTTILTYTQRHTYLYDADEDPQNDQNVILMYSGESRYWKEYSSPSNTYSPQTFNTEHVYPQSRLNASDAITDLHHLRVCDDRINQEKSNSVFVNASGAYQSTNSGWYPGDSWKGDVARMILYLNIRYDEVISDMGTLEMFLSWNIEDPVSAFEINRNNIIEGAQGNRNPFIDNPYLVTLIWGGNNAQNTWD